MARRIKHYITREKKFPHDEVAKYFVTSVTPASFYDVTTLLHLRCYTLLHHCES